MNTVEPSEPFESSESIVTVALVYANGPLHLGHLVESIQADIWVRFQRMQGHRCYFIGGSDAHGTAIMMHAEKKGISPEQLVSEIKTEHQAVFKAFSIEFDAFESTHSPENQVWVNRVFLAAQAKGMIHKKCIVQPYDCVKQLFLPDRYIKGTCPQCQAPDQHGDSCEQCGSIYEAMALINPVSVLSGSRPIEKATEHYFFDLPQYQALLEDWVKTGIVQSEVRCKLSEWFKQGLKAWDISRDSPYFGFEIPSDPGKYFYVWLDAPIGYIAILDSYCHQHQELSIEACFQPQSKQALYHFVGKDIVYFHALFWPACLAAADLRLPTAVFAHGFLTVNGQKMSKSRGTLIEASQYLSRAPADVLRYYFASKLNTGIDDIDFNLDDFVQRIHADLIGKWVNLASRCAGFIHSEFDGRLCGALEAPELYQDFVDQGEAIATCFQARQYAQAMRLVMQLADKANHYIHEKKPWLLKKQDGGKPACHAVVSMGIQLFYCLVIYLKPVLPEVVLRAEQFLNSPNLQWADRQKPLLGHTITAYRPLLVRLDLAHLQSLLNG